MSWLTKAIGTLNKPVAKPHVPRRADRHMTSGFSCPLGEILDLSASGMRVFCRKRPAFTKGQVLSLCLQSPFQKLALRASVAWTRQVKLGVFHMGLKFVDMQPGMGEGIETMAKHGFADVPNMRPGNRSAAGKAGSACSSSHKFNDHMKIPHTEASGAPLQASASFSDYYSVFGLRMNASDDEIQKAYRVLARRYHPDLCKEPDTERVFAMITEAYQILSDAETRRAYDQRLRERAA